MDLANPENLNPQVGKGRKSYKVTRFPMFFQIFQPILSYKLALEIEHRAQIGYSDRTLVASGSIL